jgi:hypothetical protein
VSPSNADFVDRISPRTSDDEQLDIERETVEILDGGQIPSEVAWKELEAALRVVDIAQSKRAHDEVEGSSHEVSVAGLTNFDEASLNGPRPDSHATVLRSIRQ